MKWGKCIFIYLIFFHFFFMNNQKLFFTILFFLFFYFLSSKLYSNKHGFKNRIGPASPTGWTANRSSFRSLDQMETEPGLDRLNRRSNRWTGRFWGKKTGSNYFKFFFGFPNAHFQYPYSNFQNKWRHKFYIY